MISALLKILLYRSPSINIEKEEAEQYNQLLASIGEGQSQVLEYMLPYPKFRFLFYVSMKEKYEIQRGWMI